jgi:hypothetical protein
MLVTSSIKQRRWERVRGSCQPLLLLLPPVLLLLLVERFV